jgi:hypothetical protein
MQFNDRGRDVGAVMALILASARTCTGPVNKRRGKAVYTPTPHAGTVDPIPLHLGSSVLTGLTDTMLPTTVVTAAMEVYQWGGRLAMRRWYCDSCNGVLIEEKRKTGKSFIHKILSLSYH